MRECNNSKIHISSNFLLSKSLIRYEDIATEFEQEYVRCVRNEKECVCSAPNFFFPGATTPLGVVFYSPLTGFSLFACEVT